MRVLLSLLILLGGTVAPTATPPDTGPGSRQASDFPRDIPVYPPAKDAAFRSRAGQAVAGFSTSDDPAKVASFYLDFAKKKGWKPDPDIVAKRSDGQVLVLHKDARVLRVDVVRDPDRPRTEVFLTVGIPAVDTPSPSPSPKARP